MTIIIFIFQSILHSEHPQGILLICFVFCLVDGTTRGDKLVISAKGQGHSLQKWEENKENGCWGGIFCKPSTVLLKKEYPYGTLIKNMTR